MVPIQRIGMNTEKRYR